MRCSNCGYECDSLDTLTDMCDTCRRAYDLGVQHNAPIIRQTADLLLLTRKQVIQWDDGELSPVTFALIPENWQNKELDTHPLDDEIFYWLSAYEWLSFGIGFSNDEWRVIS